MPFEPGDYRLDIPTASVFEDLDQYIPLMLSAVDGWLDFPTRWIDDDPDGTAHLYMEDLRAFLQDLPLMMVPIGGIMLWPGAEIPDNYLLCDGTAYAPEAYPGLFDRIGTVYGTDGGNFRVPNLASRFPLGVGGAYTLGANGGSETVTLTESEMPEHGHSVASHHHSIPEHSHTISNHQHTINGHSHSIPAHSHSISPNPHSHGIETRSNASAFGDASRLANPSGTGTATSRSTLETTLEVSSEALITAIDGSGVTNLAGGGSTSVQAEFNTNPTGLNTNQTGGGDPHNNMPPYLALNYIIRAN